MRFAITGKKVTAEETIPMTKMAEILHLGLVSDTVDRGGT